MNFKSLCKIRPRQAVGELLSALLIVVALCMFFPPVTALAETADTPYSSHQTSSSVRAVNTADSGNRSSFYIGVFLVSTGAIGFALLKIQEKKNEL